MVGTVSAARRLGGRGALVAAGAAFAAGLGLGAALIFGALGALGAAIEPGRAFLIGAAALAAAAVISDLAGFRVRPQVRFQVPEPWRRSMPLPQALFLYGVLLGTGVTTFVPRRGRLGALAALRRARERSGRSGHRPELRGGASTSGARARRARR